jgi:intraflagellar transport protein 88
MKMKIKKNVGLAYVKQKKFGKAIEVYEDVMSDTPDFDIGFNLIVCLYALGEKEKMRTWFERLLMIDIPGIDEEEQEELAQMQTKLGAGASGATGAGGAATQRAGGNPEKTLPNINEADPLKEYLKDKKKEALNYVSSAAKLVAPIIE